jgi:hypothetical protein
VRVVACKSSSTTEAGAVRGSSFYQRLLSLVNFNKIQLIDAVHCTLSITIDFDSVNTCVMYMKRQPCLCGFNCLLSIVCFGCTAKRRGFAVVAAIFNLFIACPSWFPTLFQRTLYVQTEAGKHSRAAPAFDFCEVFSADAHVTTLQNGRHDLRLSKERASPCWQP